MVRVSILFLLRVSLLLAVVVRVPTIMLTEHVHERRHKSCVVQVVNRVSGVNLLRSRRKRNYFLETYSFGTYLP